MGTPNPSDYNHNVFVCYESINGSCWRLSRPVNIQIFMFLGMGITIMMTVMGNTLVIISVAHFKQLHTPTNHLVLSLAMCDFFLGVFVMPLSSMRSVYGCWYLSNFMCKVHTGMDIMLSTASIFHLTCVSAERFCAVCNPLTYRLRFGSTTVLFLVSASWIISAAFAYAMVFGELNLKGSEDFYRSQVSCVGGCHVFFSHGSAVVTSTVAFFIPGLIMFVVYSRIFIIARRQSRSINNLGNQFNMHSQTSGLFRNRTSKATKTIGVVNSALNPFIYEFFYPWFRKALRIIVSGEVFHRNSSRFQLYS